MEVIKQLIASDIDVNVKRNRGDTPLHIAARFSRYEIAKLLISKGEELIRKVNRVERHWILPILGITDRPPNSSANTVARRDKN